MQGMPPQQSGMPGDSFTIPNTLVGYVIGKGGENIRNIQMHTQTHVQIQREQDMLPGAQERMVTITGPPEGIAQARSSIMSMIDSRRMEMARSSAAAPSDSGAPSGSSEIKMQIPDEKVGLLIGKQGQTIKNIQQRTGTHIQVSRANTHCVCIPCRFVVTGFLLAMLSTICALPCRFLVNPMRTTPRCARSPSLHLECTRPRPRKRRCSKQ
jgi:rRNA processing protein Krr1/Pno1